MAVQHGYGFAGRMATIDGVQVEDIHSAVLGLDGIVNREIFVEAAANTPFTKVPGFADWRAIGR